jgi:hypothetical protein
VPKRVLSAKPLAPYQQHNYTLIVCEVTPQDPFEGDAKYVSHEIHDREGTVLFESKSMISKEIAIDIIHALEAHHEDGRQLGRIEKTAEIRKVLEIHS